MSLTKAVNIPIMLACIVKLLMKWCEINFNRTTNWAIFYLDFSLLLYDKIVRTNELHITQHCRMQLCIVCIHYIHMLHMHFTTIISIWYTVHTYLAYFIEAHSKHLKSWMNSMKLSKYIISSAVRIHHFVQWNIRKWYEHC